jgi:Uri superfamily endonuclease
MPLRSNLHNSYVWWLYCLLLCMKGSYVLVLQLSKDREITVGKLGTLLFKKGYYVYVGSALNGLEHRLQRHLRNEKRLHWHIDYLLAYASIVDIFFREGDTREECAIAHSFASSLISIPHFGCSDCSCKSHLFFGTYKEIKDCIVTLELASYILTET